MTRTVLSVALLLLPSTALAQEQYSITDLGCAGCGPGFEGGAYALNNNNDEVVGMARHADGQAYPFYWYDGASFELPNAVGATSWANDINVSSLIVGSVAAGPQHTMQRPVVWQPPQPAGAYTLLPQPPDTNHGAVWRVNGLGHAVGITWLDSGTDHPSLWRPQGEGWVVTELPYLSSVTIANVSGISSSGALIAGTSRSMSGFARPVIWEQGLAAGTWEVTDLGTLGGPRGQATDVISEDEISGLSMTADAHWHATIWRRIEGVWTADEDLGVLTGDLTSASWSSNGGGQVVGWCIASGVADNPLNYLGPSTAFLWEAGVMHDLNDLLVDADGWHLRQAWDISDTGRICGLGVAPNGELHGFLLEPVCAADVTGDGAVGVEDLVEVILNWGPCDSCPADVDGSGLVDVQDLVEVILNWGPCP